MTSSLPEARAASHPYDLVVFDLDGTLVQGTIFIWQTLHDTFGTDRERRRQAKDDYFAGKISYKAWFEHDLELLGQAGATRAGMLASMDSLHPTPGALETLETLAREGYRLAILSGSLDIVLERFFSEVPFAEVMINRLHFDGEGCIAGGVHTPFDMDQKGAGLAEIARRQGTTLTRTAFVGDNFNDLSAAREAGLAIAFNPRSDELAALAKVVITEPDLRAILPHLL